MAYPLPVPGAAVPHGYSRCWLPPAAVYSHSDSLGRNPPSQMQNAYASYQSMQLIGRFSRLPTEFVHVLSAGPHARLVLVGAMLPLSDVTQPVSKLPGLTLFPSPWPPFRCACLPEPATGS